MRSLTLMMPMFAAPAVSDSNWKELVLESSVPVIVDFWAPWCGPCRMIAPLIDELAVEYGDKIKAVRLLGAITSQTRLFCCHMGGSLLNERLEVRTNWSPEVQQMMSLPSPVPSA